MISSADAQEAYVIKGVNGIEEAVERTTKKRYDNLKVIGLGTVHKSLMSRVISHAHLSKDVVMRYES